MESRERGAGRRSHARLGQDKPVNVYRLVATGTVEEKVMALKARKGELVASVLEGIDGSGGQGGSDDPDASAHPDLAAATPSLSVDDLRALLDG